MLLISTLLGCLASHSLERKKLGENLLEIRSLSLALIAL